MCGGGGSDNLLLLNISFFYVYSRSVFWITSFGDVILPLSVYLFSMISLLDPVPFCIGRIFLNCLPFP